MIPTNRLKAKLRAIFRKEKLNSTARVSKRPSHQSAACLRARYCARLTQSDLDESEDF